MGVAPPNLKYLRLKQSFVLEYNSSYHKYRYKINKFYPIDALGVC